MLLRLFIESSVEPALLVEVCQSGGHGSIKILELVFLCQVRRQQDLPGLGHVVRVGSEVGDRETRKFGRFTWS